MRANYILAIDEGTTSTRALIVDGSLRVISESRQGFRQYFPKPGWVEHDLHEIWEAVGRTIAEATKNIDVKKIAGIGITNQRETLCFWDKKTGRPLARAIVWQDRRTAGLCERLKKQGLESFFQKKTGLLLDPYFSGTKALWALQNWGTVSSAYKKGRLAAGTIDSYLIARLSGARAHVTDPSNACRSLAFNLKRLCWDKDLAKALDVPQEIWPQIKPSAGPAAWTKGLRFLPDGIPITGILGDQQAALLGQACIAPGMAKCTYGTGAFLVMNTGASAVESKHRLLSSVAWTLAHGETTYMLEGSAFVAGAAVEWLRDGLGLIKESGDIEKLARSVDSSDGVVFVPALTGLGAPHWQPQASGLLTGLTRGTTAAHVARAVLEGIAFENVDIIAAMEKDLGRKIKILKVDGGAAGNNLLMQLQADFLGAHIYRPKYLETTSMGAVFAAGLGLGIWQDIKNITRAWRKDRIFKPRINSKERADYLKRWQWALSQATLLN